MNLLDRINQAQLNLEGVVTKTPLQMSTNLSETFSAQIQLKREDLQLVRSYKLRGAYHKISTLSPVEKANGVVCASAGNHAQGVAFACKKLHIKGMVFMPVTTPKQKIRQVEKFGRNQVEIVLKGDTFDESFAEAQSYSTKHQAELVHPFDDEKVMAGQGTIGLEMLNDSREKIDYLFLPIGGGGLASGVSTVFKKYSPETKIIGVEPAGAASMKTSIERQSNTTLTAIDKFVDGAAVKRVGETTFQICRKNLDDVISVPEGKVCQTILRLYDQEAIVAEPAGALTTAALDSYRHAIEGKNVVCVVSGGNNDITRMEEIKERALLYEKRKHYFMVNFPQRPGALKEFVNLILGPKDDITYFQFTQKNNRESGPAVVGIELKNHEDFLSLEKRLKKREFNYQYLNKHEDLFRHLVL